MRQRHGISDRSLFAVAESVGQVRTDRHAFTSSPKQIKCNYLTLQMVDDALPSDYISNLQLAHWTCNRQKADKLQKEGGDRIIPGKLISNRNLPQSADWSKYKG